MSKLYEIRRGKDLKWGIYSTEYNIRIAEFYPNTKADREQLKTFIQKNPEVTEKWMEEKVLDIYELLSKAMSILAGMASMIFNEMLLLPGLEVEKKSGK